MHCTLSFVLRYLTSALVSLYVSLMFCLQQAGAAVGLGADQRTFYCARRLGVDLIPNSLGV